MKQSGAAEYEENEADIHAVCELAEDVIDAVMKYQVSQISPPTPFYLRRLLKELDGEGIAPNGRSLVDTR